MDRKTLEALVVHLKKGEAAILPFDTCYGLVCDGTSVPACTRLYQLKQRPRYKPAALVVPDVETVESYALLSEAQRKIIQRLLPGGVTIILRLKEGITLPRGFVQTQYDTVGFRVIKSELINRLLKAMKKPLLATSANVDSQPVILSNTDLIMHPFNQERLKRVFTQMDEVYQRPSHSTVIDLTTDIPEIVRPGVVSDATIKRAL